MKRRAIRPFLIVVIDEDQRLFSIEGPMTDDTSLNAAICRARDEGRAVRCFTTQSDRNDAIAYQERQGLKFAESIPLPPVPLLD
jgi:hypothetical protein